MKRPLVTAAAGFVLGEVLALQYKQAAASYPLERLVWTLVPAMVLAFGAGLVKTERLGLFGFRKVRLFRRMAWNRKTTMQGGGAGKRALLLFFALLLSGGFCGYERSLQVKTELDREEEIAGAFQGAKVTVTGRIHKAEHMPDRMTVVLEGVCVKAGRKEGLLKRVMVYLNKEWGDGLYNSENLEYRPDRDYELAVGMEAEVRGRLDIVEGSRNPGEFDFNRYYRSKGIVCRMLGEEIETVGGEAIPYYNSLARLRLLCSCILDRICLPEDSPMFKAVLLGDTAWMEPQVRSMYQRNGISHLLAVSGQHLAIIGGGLYVILRKCGLTFKTAGAVAGIMVVSFGIMTGSSGSAMRAVIMILCLWLAAAAGRSYDTLSALGLAALALLFRQPYLLFQSGFQLSFGAVLAIGGMGGWMIKTWDIEKGWQKTLAVSLCVQMVITPVALYHFYLYPLYGILMNLLVIPLISILMYSGILGIILGSVWIQGGAAAAGAGHYILRVYEWLCRMAERLPGYSLVIGRPQWWQIALYAAGVAGMLYGGMVWMGRGADRIMDSGSKKAGDEKTVKVSHRISWPVPIKGLVFGACTYSLCFLALLPVPVKGLEVVCLDVGQGDGIVMETKDGVILVDGGSSSEKSLGDKTLEPFLKSRGIDVIDYSIVSHGDIDHISGLLYLIEESKDVKIKHLILPAPGRGQAVYQRLEQAAAEKGIGVRYMKPGDKIELGQLRLSCLYAGGAFAASKEDRNAHSLVFCADYKAFHMLFTGDMGMEQEQELLIQLSGNGRDKMTAPSLRLLQREHLGHITVLKTAHHGSANSSSQEFLERLSPKLAVISYGRGNSYGHPSPQVLDRFEALEIPVLETGIGGAVILKTDGSRLRQKYFFDD